MAGAAMETWQLGAVFIAVKSWDDPSSATTAQNCHQICTMPGLSRIGPPSQMGVNKMCSLAVHPLDTGYSRCAIVPTHSPGSRGNEAGGCVLKNITWNITWSSFAD